MHRFSRIIPFLLWAATATQAWSQWTKEVGQRGFVQGTAFDISTVDSVDTVNGNVVLRVPLAALPAGHAGMGVGVTLTYNSGMYDGATAYFPADPPAYYSVGTRITLAGTGDANAVWGYGYNYGVYTELRDPQPAIVPGEVVGIYGNGCAPTQTGSVDVSQSTNSGLYPLRMRAVFPDGSTHVLVLMNPFMSTSDGWSSVASNGAIVGCFAGTNPQPPPVSLPLNYVTVDGTYVRVTIGGPNNPDGWFMQFPDGKSVKGVDLTTDTITDRNGNSVVIAHSDQSRACYPLKGDSSDSVITIKDTFGRCIQIENGLQANMAEWISQAAADGTTLVSKVNFGFVGIDYTYSYGPGSCQFAYQCTPTSDPGCAGTGTCTPVVQMMVTSVDLSQAGFTSPLSYSFAYNNNDTGCQTHAPQCQGQVTDITLPHGAGLSTAAPTIHYTFDVPGGFTPQDMPILSKVLTHYDPYTLQQLTDTWSYVLNTPNGGVSNSVTNPDGSTATYYAYMEASLGSGLDGHTFKVDRSDSRGSLLDRTEQYWQFNVDPYGQTGVSSQQINPFVRAEFRSIAPANSTTPTLSAIAINTEDVNGNITRVDESDWVDYKTVTILTHGVETDIEQLPSISPARTTINSYYMLADAGSNVGNAYWRTTAPLILNAKTSTEIETSGVPTAYSEFDYDDPTGAGTNTTSGAGNVFHEWRWDSTRLLLFPGAVSSGGGSGTLSSSNAIVTTRTYAHGDLLTETDPRGNPTSLQYNDPAHPYPTDLFEADGEHWQFTWDIPSGLRISETDPNNGTTTAQYWPRGRTKSIVSSDSAGSVTYRQAITTYDDSVQTTLVQKDLNKVNDGKVQTATATDDLGHVWKTLSTDGSCPTQIQTIHLQQTLPKGQQPPLDGYSYQLVSNPFCSTSDATMGWTRTQLDPLGRVTQVAHFTGSALPAPWGSNNTTSGIIQTKYDSNQYTVTDEAGVSRTLSTDGFNRLSSALDGTGVTASYTYDALGNLTSVAQGSQSRTVLYTSLGQLKSATNPENGTIAYTYDDNGNLATRTDARGVIATLSTSSYPYDRLNRVVLKSYSDGTPSVTYCYDGNIYGGSPGQCSAGTGFVNPVGHLTQVTSSVSNTTYTNYDLAGRIISSTQNTNGTPYPFSYAYL